MGQLCGFWSSLLSFPHNSHSFEFCEGIADFLWGKTVAFVGWVWHALNGCWGSEAFVLYMFAGVDLAVAKLAQRSINLYGILGTCYMDAVDGDGEGKIA